MNVFVDLVFFEKNGYPCVLFMECIRLYLWLACFDPKDMVEGSCQTVPWAIAGCIW